MKRVLLTGMSGTGKSTVIEELAARGYIRQILSTEDVDLIFLSGCAPNQVRFYPQFDHIILLTAAAPVITARLTTRTNNPYGKQPAELARVLHLQQTIEPPPQTRRRPGIRHQHSGRPSRRHDPSARAATPPLTWKRPADGQPPT
jgi:hypothetical protein